MRCAALTAELGSARLLALPHPRHQRRSRRVAGPLDLRPADDDHRDAGRPVSVRGRPLVQHAVRARRHHHRDGGALDRAGDRARRAGLPGRQPGARDRRPSGTRSPGKILHEARGGEMAALGEVPFGRYYGSVDATPLFVMLAAAYLRRTGDLAFVRALAPHVERALAWIERDGDADGDGFVEYARATDKGLVQQGWKDSHDSVFHADGALAEGPIALCEVQGYVYGAFLGAAEIATALGHAGARRGLPAQGADPARPVRGEVLGRGARHLRAGARRAQAPLPGAELERGPRALDRDRRAGARAAGRRVADERGELLRLGDPHARRRRGPLQPDVVPQRLGLAARQRAHRRRVRRATASTISGCACSSRCWGPARWSTCTGCPSCSAASGAGPARGRRSTRSPARRRPGRRRRCSCCSARRWGSPSTARAARCRSIHPVLPPPSASCGSPASRSASGRIDLLLENHPHDVGLTVLRREGDVSVVVVK